MLWTMKGAPSRLGNAPFAVEPMVMPLPAPPPDAAVNETSTGMTVGTGSAPSSSSKAATGRCFASFSMSRSTADLRSACAAGARVDDAVATTVHALHAAALCGLERSTRQLGRDLVAFEREPVEAGLHLEEAALEDDRVQSRIDRCGSGRAG